MKAKHEFIDRNAFIVSQCNNCDGSCEKVDCDCLNCKSEWRCDMIKDLADFPAADARPVVTCGRCKYADSFSPTCTESTFPLKCLSIRYGGVYPDWFCEHGEIAQKSNCGASMKEES